MSTCPAPHTDLQVDWKKQHISQHSSDILTKEGLNLVLLGKMRAGKSATGNTILGREAFISKKISKSVTKDVAVESGTVGHIPVTVYDTPGLFDTHMTEEEIQQKCESGPCVFLLVIKADTFTEEDQKTVEKIEKLLGEKRLEKTWILFTRGDELEDENMTIKEFIDDNETLKKLVQKYDQRYHVFNNKKRGQREQVQTLLIKILKPYFDIQEEVLEGLKSKKKDIEPAAPADRLSSRRIVLLGKSGVGKSAAGNTILGQKEFNSVMGMNSVTSECSDVHATVSGRSVSVVDTPGFFDTKMEKEELVIEIARSVYISSPGPHAFIIVFPVNNRFTDQEQQIPQIIEMMFGQDVLKYSIILFTHGDQLEKGKSVEELIKENSALRDLVQQCGDRYHVFNNKDQNNRDQVNDLLQKIDTMIEQNGGGHYSNQMFEDAQRFRREEEERRKREEEERKQQMEKELQEEIKRARKEEEERIRAEYEERLKAEQKANESKGFGQFLSKYWSHILKGAVVVGLIGCGVGVGIALYAGAAAGGAAAGGAIGFTAGAVVGAVGTGAYYYTHNQE